MSCGRPVAGHAQRDAAKLARAMVSKWLTPAARAPRGSCRDGVAERASALVAFLFQRTQTRLPAAHGARAVQHVRPRIWGGRREGRALAAPVARLRKECRRQVPQVWPNTPGPPCATVGTAYTWSPWCTGLVGHHARRRACARRRGTPASGCQDRTISPCATNRSSARHEATLRFLAPIASHLPRLVTVATRPSGGSRTGRDIHDFGKNEIKIFGQSSRSSIVVVRASVVLHRGLPDGAPPVGRPSRIPDHDVGRADFRLASRRSIRVVMFTRMNAEGMALRGDLPFEEVAEVRETPPPKTIFVVDLSDGVEPHPAFRGLDADHLGG